MKYREYKPGHLLRDYVEAYVSFSWNDPDGKDAPVQRCLPHGIPGLIVHIAGDRSYFIDKGQRLTHPEAYFVGIMKEAANWGMPSGSASFGVQFKPEGLVRLFNEPLASCFNGYVDAEDFFNRKLTSVISRIQDASNDEQRIFLMENYLHNRLKDLHTARNYISESIRLIRSSVHEISMKELSRQVCVCERQLQRSFKNTIGLSPKYYQRINRFSKAFRMTGSSKADWSQLAYQLGYSDQAHFIRDFKEFTGDSPGRFFAQS